MDAEQVSEIIDTLRSAETDLADVEAKRATEKLPKSIRETLSSFSNTSGGILILGLDEASGFSATGVEDARKMAADLASACTDEMEPTLRPLIKIHSFEGANLVIAEIPELEPSQKPCYYRGAGMSKGSYVRVGDSDRQLTQYEVQMLLASRGQPRNDEQPIANSSLALLDAESLGRFIGRLRATRPHSFSDLSEVEVLTRMKVLVKDEAASGRLVLSMAGLLALGTAPQAELPQVNLTFVNYPTDSGEALPSGERFLDNVTIDGPVPVIVKSALDAVRRNMSRQAVISGAGRADHWEYPEAALREAIVNALVHRDLSPPALGTQVQIEMFPSRLRIRNPGGLFGPVTLERLGEEGVSSSRNAVLLKILEEVPIPGEDRTVCENRGSGIRTMSMALRAAGMSPPEFKDRISTFEVMFPNHTLLSKDTVEWIAALQQEGLTDSQHVALALLRDRRLLDNHAYRVAAGLDSRVATSELQDLVGRELIRQSGTGRWAKYTLTRRAASVDPHRIRLRPADRRDEIMSALGDDTLSRAEIASRTGLTDQTVRRWLRVLREEGRVKISEGPLQSKKAKYKRIPGSGSRAGQLDLLHLPTEDEVERE